VYSLNLTLFALLLIACLLSKKSKKNKVK